MFFVLLNYGKLLRDELYVMLMLQRSEALAGGSSSSTSDCDDPMVKVACSMDTDACPAACKTESKDDEPTVVKAGDLAVTATASAGRKAIIGAVSDLDTLKFRTSENVEITKVVLERYGYSSRNDVDKVWLEDENGNVISSEASVGTRDQASLSIKKDYRAVDGTLNATIVVRLNKPVSGDTIWFKVVDAESTAENLNLDDYTPYEYNMVDYSAASEVYYDPKGSDRSYNYAEWEMYEVAKMKLSNKSATSVDIEWFTLSQNGNMKLKDYLDEVEVTIEGDPVKAEWSINKSNELNISFKDTFALDAKSNAVFAVSVALVDFEKYGETVQLAVKDFKATERKTGVRVTPNAGTTSPVWAKYTFVGSKIKLSNNKLGNLEYGQGSTDVVIAEWTITVAEPVELIGNKNAFVVTGTYKSGSTAFTGNVIEEMRLLIAGEEYVAKKTRTNATNVAVFAFSWIELEKSGKVRVEVDINTDEDAPAGVYVEFEWAFDDAVFSGAKYTDKEEVSLDEVSGVISVSKKLTVQAWKASFTNSLTKAVEFLTNDTDTKTVFDGTYTAKKADVNLREFYAEALTGTFPTNVTATLYLYVDGKEVADVRIKNGATTWTDQISKVTIAAGESATIRVDAE